jgi:transcriptional regulator with XRE-family HTH domain
MQEVRAQLGLTIQRLRRSRKLSQEELAHIAGIDRAYMSRIERGIPNLGIEMIVRLSKALGVRPAELVEGLKWSEESAKATDE